MSGQASRKDTSTIPKFCTLDGVTEISAELEGVTLSQLSACDLIHAHTYNSDYEIFLLDPATGRALVRGGKYFVEPTEATVSGSTFGGCMLKMGSRRRRAAHGDSRRRAMLSHYAR